MRFLQWNSPGGSSPSGENIRTRGVNKIMNLAPNPAPIPTIAGTPDLGSLGANAVPSNLAVAVADAWAQEVRQEPVQEARQEPKTVPSCNTQPVTAESIRTLIGDSRDLK